MAQSSIRGSPPLTRGKVDALYRHLLAIRITPAYAGKRVQVIRYGLDGGDHPRLRGEKAKTGGIPKSVVGSPPLTRGKEKERGKMNKQTRITPAYAGKRVVVHALDRFARDHPRLRGEKCLSYDNCTGCEGSPPLTRGKVLFDAFCHCGGGITPAYAGKSIPGVLLRRRRWDHPRLRGEKLTHIV